MAVAELDALNVCIANDTRPPPLRRGAQPVHQRAPSAVYVVDRVPERALKLLDEELRADEVQRRAVDECARERRHQPAQLRATHLEVEQFLDARLRQGARFGRAKCREETYKRQLVSRVQHVGAQEPERVRQEGDRKSTRLNSS